MRRLALAFMLLSGIAAAEEKQEPSRVHYGMDLGYFHQQRFGDAQVSGLAMVMLHGQVHSYLINPYPYGQSLVLVSQVTMAKAVRNDGAWVWGLDFMPRFLFGGNEKYRLFINSGLGFNVFGPKVPELSGKMQFTILFGGGVELQTGDKTAVTLEYRATHFSNNGISYPNHGINAHTILVGAHFWR